MPQSTLDVYNIGEENERDWEPPSSAVSRELHRAESTKYACGELIEVLEVSEEEALLLIPFQEGPVTALFTMDALHEEAVDNVIPTYVQNAGQYSRFEDPSEYGLVDPAKVRGIKPIQACYDGGRGETLLNMLRLSKRLSLKSEHISSNVKVQVSQISRLQTDLQDYAWGKMHVDLGYMTDSEAGSQDMEPFPQSWDVDREDTVSDAGDLLTDLLEGSLGRTSSPLRIIEVIRAAVLGLVDSRGPMDYLDLLKGLDEIYGAFEEYKELSNTQWNAITRSIVNSLEHGLSGRRRGVGIVKREGSADDITISKGPHWDQYQTLLNIYLDFFRTIFSGEY